MRCGVGPICSYTKEYPMIEKLIEGRYIDLDLKVLNEKPNAIKVAKPAGGSFVDSTHLAYKIEQSVSERTGMFSRTRASSFAPGMNIDKGHRNFHWLKWLPPYIAQIPLGAVDVLTGPMSGCWVITYRWPGAAGDPVYVGHLGTCGTKALDDEMKAGWNQFAAQNPNALISGFQPNRAFADNLEGGLKPGEYTSIFALVTTDRRFYAVKLGRVGPFGTRFHIVKVKEVTPTTCLALQNIFNAG